MMMTFLVARKVRVIGRRKKKIDSIIIVKITRSSSKIDKKKLISLLSIVSDGLMYFVVLKLLRWQ